MRINVGWIRLARLRKGGSGSMPVPVKVAVCSARSRTGLFLRPTPGPLAAMQYKCRRPTVNLSIDI